MRTREGERGKKFQNFADIVYGWSLKVHHTPAVATAAAAQGVALAPLHGVVLNAGLILNSVVMARLFRMSI